MNLRRAAAGALALIVTSTLAAQAADIDVLASGAVKETYLELAPQFESSTGHKLNTTFTGTEVIKKRIAAGEIFDLVIVGAPEIDAFIGQGKMVPGSRFDLMTSGIGVAIKAGAPRPDISSGEAVKKALLAAKSVAYSTGSSGVHILRLFDKMGIADQMQAKSTQTISGGRRVGEYIANGEAELGFQQVSELIHERGIDYLGPLPPDIQNVAIFSSGISTGAKMPEAAKALQKFLAAPTAASVIRKNGLVPIAP